MTNLLLYNLPKEKEETLASIARGLQLSYRVILPEAFGESIGKLCGAPAHESDKAAAGLPFADEMLVLCGLAEPQLDLLLFALRTAKIPVRLKAVLTEQNIGWSGFALRAALAEEDAYLRRQ
ncbi:MAG: DUF3783 domain-containing protein [Clostridia bacterium]|nr:DUF3783 domain-containing protein [Clostridia bacterium]